MIVTFYSYKGGVGRSMAMVNVGEILADVGYDVTLCDFDLEAPGLERYVSDKPDMVKALRAQCGVLDLLEEYKEMLASPQDPDSGPAEDFADMNGLRLRRPASYATLIRSESRQRRGKLRFLGAGRRDESHAAGYSQSVRQFDWSDFYDRWAGAAYLDFFREDLTAGQSIVLVDSRTGVTEHGGVCTHHLADLVVLVSAPNDINIEGTKWMASLLATADVTALRKNRPLQVMPVAGRVETASQVEELREFRRRFEDEFVATVPTAAGDGRAFIQATEIPYIPYYAFTEKVVARETDTPHRELFSAYTALARAIVAVGLNAGLLPRPRRREWAPADLVEQAAQTLTTILDRHKRWLATGHEEGARAVLRGRDLSRQELTGADLSEADLTEANLAQADLREARMAGAELSRAVLRGARLDRADLSGAVLQGADLSNAVLIGAAFDYCDLAEANLQAADAAQVTWRAASLVGARLNRANLYECDLRDSRLTGAALLGADLRSANLLNATGLDPDELAQAIIDGRTQLPDLGRAADKPTPTGSAAAEIVPVRAQRDHLALVDDFRFLDQRLLPHFQASSHRSAILRDRLSAWHALVVGITVISVLIAAITAGGLTAGAPDDWAWAGVPSAAVAAIAGASLLTSWYRRLGGQGKSAELAADRLQAEYFLFLGRSGSYADPAQRHTALENKIASIQNEVE